MTDKPGTSKPVCPKCSEHVHGLCAPGSCGCPKCRVPAGVEPRP